MTNNELILAIRAEIERQMKYYEEKEMKAWDDSEHGDEDALWYQGHKKMCAKLLSFLNTLESEKPMNQDELEKAVVDYFEGYWPGMETAEQCNTDLRFTPPAIMRLARHFAQWQKEQMMKEAVEGEVRHVATAHYVLTNEDQLTARLKQFQDGDKVRIIIVKEDKK